MRAPPVADAASKKACAWSKFAERSRESKFRVPQTGSCGLYTLARGKNFVLVAAHHAKAKDPDETVEVFDCVGVYLFSRVAVCERRRWRIQRAKRLVPRSKCGDANSEQRISGTANGSMTAG